MLFFQNAIFHTIFEEKWGFRTKFSLSLFFCENETYVESIFRQHFKTTPKNNKSFNVNKALVIALRSIGKGCSVERKVLAFTAPKMKFSIKDFFSKWGQIRRKLWIWWHLLKKSLIEIFIFCEVFTKSFSTYPSTTLFYLKCQIGAGKSANYEKHHTKCLSRSVKWS